MSENQEEKQGVKIVGGHGNLTTPGPKIVGGAPVKDNVEIQSKRGK